MLHLVLWWGENLNDVVFYKKGENAKLNCDESEWIRTKFRKKNPDDVIYNHDFTINFFPSTSRCSILRLFFLSFSLFPKAFFLSHVKLQTATNHHLYHTPFNIILIDSTRPPDAFYENEKKCWKINELFRCVFRDGLIYSVLYLHNMCMKRMQIYAETFFGHDAAAVSTFAQCL